MFRNQYDTDVTVWSPEGRLLQVNTLIHTLVSFAKFVIALTAVFKCCIRLNMLWNL